MSVAPFSRPLIFVAHPDDETLACGGLLQRVPASLVVFATDGTPAGFGLERKYGSLQAYTELRFREASGALRHVPSASFGWLTRPDGSYFGDMHVYEDLPEAATSLRAIAESFSPDAIVSHTYEGGHIDHDACSFIAMHVAEGLSLKRFEFVARGVVKVSKDFDLTASSQKAKAQSPRLPDTRESVQPIHFSF